SSLRAAAAPRVAGWLPASCARPRESCSRLLVGALDRAAACSSAREIVYRGVRFAERRVDRGTQRAVASRLQRRRDMPATRVEAISHEELERVSGGYSQALFSAMQQAVNMGLTINSTTTGGHAPNSMHYKGRAFDAIGTSRQMQDFYNWAASN